MESGSHIIGRQLLKLRYRGDRDVPSLRRMLSQVCTETLPDGLSRLLDRHDRPGFVQRIDRLDVRVSIREGDDLEAALAHAILEQADVALTRELAQRDADLVPQQTGALTALLFYLRCGYLPWWLGDANRSHYLEDLALSIERGSLAGLAKELIPMLSSRDVRTRLLRLLRYDQIVTLFASSGIWSTQDWEALSARLEELRDFALGSGIAASAYERIAGMALTEAVRLAASPAWMIDHIAIVLAKNGVPIPNSVQTPISWQGPEKGEPDQETNDLKERPPTPLPVEGEAIYVRNAGLVLLSAYLPALFRNTELLHDGVLQDVPRALSLLRYLVHGAGSFEEYDIMLEKILCGLPLATAIGEQASLTENETSEADGLLESVIAHWTALKGTSPAGLREGFLQREGHLKYEAGQWELKVQRKAQDVLLDFLPWSFSMIRHRWMKELLIVKWNNT